MNINEVIAEAVNNNDIQMLTAIASEQANNAEVTHNQLTEEQMRTERLTAELDSLRLRLDAVRLEFGNFRTTASHLLNTLLDSDDTETLAGLDEMKPLAEHLGVELDSQFEVTVTLNYNLTVRAPRGTDRGTVRNAIEWQGEPRFFADGDIEIEDVTAGWDFDVEVSTY